MSFPFIDFWRAYDSNVGALNIVPEVSEAVLISFYSLSFFCTCVIYLYHSIIQLIYPFFCLNYFTVSSLQSIFHLSYYIVHYWWLCFIPSRSLLNISYVFSIWVSSLFICISILFSRFCIIFTIIIWILFQVDSLFLHLWFGLVVFFIFFHLLGISLPFHFIWYSVFMVCFLQAGGS